MGRHCFFSLLSLRSFFSFLCFFFEELSEEEVVVEEVEPLGLVVGSKIGGGEKVSCTADRHCSSREVLSLSLTID